MDTVEQKQWRGHPSGLAVLFSTEMWERFSFYGMRALLVLYLIEALELPKEGAYAIYGVYGALCYGSAVLGGLVASRWLGDRICIIYGGVTMAIGHLVLAWPTLMGAYLGLALVCVGNGLFKPNISNSVGRLYTPEDPRRQSGFYLFYVGINIGSMAAPIICGGLGERVGWHLGFGLAGLGMLVGLLIFLKGQHRIVDVQREGEWQRVVSAGHRRRLTLGIAMCVAVAVLSMRLPALGQGLVATAGVVAMVALWVVAVREGGAAAVRIYVLLALMAFHTIFWAAFEQAGSSFNVLTRELVDRQVWGVELPATLFQAVNGCFIVLLTPAILRLWRLLARAGINLSVPAKFALGLGLLGAGFSVLGWGTRLGVVSGSVELGWLIACYLLHTLGELCLSPVGLAMVTQLLPARLGAFGMGAWFMTYANGHLLASLIARWTTNSAAQSGDAAAMMRYADVFTDVAAWVYAAALALLVLLQVTRKHLPAAVMR